MLDAVVPRKELKSVHRASVGIHDTSECSTHSRELDPSRTSCVMRYTQPPRLSNSQPLQVPHFPTGSKSGYTTGNLVFCARLGTDDVRRLRDGHAHFLPICHCPHVRSRA